MITDTSKADKVLGKSPFASSLEQIFLVNHSRGTFSGMLKEIRGPKLVFETRGGRCVVIHEDEIRSAIDVTPQKRP